ncbi:MAG: hypothetical protein C0424_11950 [Sphingobacteriaceae bacterium]|nr:hypothetical protein [Sphingobacteriaceae bacterium]
MMFNPHFIYSDRHFQTWPSWQIVFEWEDALSSALHMPIVKSPTTGMLEHKFRGWDNRTQQGKWGKRMHDLRPWKTSWQKEKRQALYFEMAPRKYPAFSNHPRVAPILIDVFPDGDLQKTLLYYAQCERVYFTSLEVFHAAEEAMPGGPWYHLPMSLPDKYRLLGTESFEKKYPIVLSGRTNPVLLGYLKQFVSENPGTEYLQQQLIDGKLCYVSNLSGLIGEFSGREDYWKLIKSAQVCFYATPGMDDAAGRTGGFNPLTPRWFELLAAGCHVIARYPDTVETRHYKMASVIEAVQHYDDFKTQLSKMLLLPPPVAQNAIYLENFYTSKIIPYLALTT